MILSMMMSLVSRFQCPGCGYVYDEEKGDDHEGYPPGFALDNLPEEFVCPNCSVRYKEDFLKDDT
jgi:rubredoxin